jgi:hypothetical protein
LDRKRTLILRARAADACTRARVPTNDPNDPHPSLFRYAAGNARRLRQHVSPRINPLDSDGIKRAKFKEVAADKQGIISLTSSIFSSAGLSLVPPWKSTIPCEHAFEQAYRIKKSWCHDKACYEKARENGHEEGVKSSDRNTNAGSPWRR